MSSWNKHGRIIQASGNGNWYHSGFSGSQALLRSNSTIELFLTGRDQENRSRIGSAIFDLSQQQLISVSEKPLLDLGERGTFDFNGTGYPFVVETNGKQYLYYTGWTKGAHTDFINDLGLAIRSEGKEDFNRISRASIFCRTNDEPFGTGSVCVMQDEGKWKIWYTCFDRWESNENGFRHYYQIKYAEGNSVTDWSRSNHIAIPYNPSSGEYVTAKPYVMKYQGLYLMWYSFRGEAYKIGFAVSKDGSNWLRHDNSQLCLKASDSGWDSEMVCYASVIINQQTAYMFYNGNGYGKSGLGYASMDLASFNNELKNQGYLN